MIGADRGIGTPRTVMHLVIWLALGFLIAAPTVAALAWGWDYYRAPLDQRPFDSHHSLLRPSSRAGLLLGITAVGLFVLNLGYLVRKRLISIRHIGSLRVWMDFHIVTGIAGGALVAFHTAFAPYSALGILALAALLITILTGIVGRYIYVHVPRSLEGRELEIEQVREQLEQCRDRLEQSGVEAGWLHEGQLPQMGLATSTLLTSFISLVTGDRQRRRDYRELRRAILSSKDLRPMARQILPLAREFCRHWQWMIRYHQWRDLLASWRFLHRWLAIVMLIVASFHIALAVWYGDLSILGGDAMTLLDPKAPLLFGIVMIGLLAVYLVVFHAMPGSLATPHADVIPGTGLETCDRCHAEGGLTEGCLTCHEEIAAQMTAGQGFHAFMAHAGHNQCATCHPEHLGSDFPLVSALSWGQYDPNDFKHSHVSFTLTGAHDGLACDLCHQERLSRPFALSSFPKHPRKTTYLGLTQACIDCHTDIHAGGLARECQSCHDQQQWRPASGFRHDEYFVLEGVHARTECSGCHLIPQKDAETLPDANSADIHLPFNRVNGKTCAECHESPHRTRWAKDCTVCHLGADDTWAEGGRGMTPETHALTGFPLEKPHANVACEKCHPGDLAYARRYPDPNGNDYARQSDTCAGCHEDPHAGQFSQQYSSCLDCHDRNHFSPAPYDVTRHAEVFPLSEAHREVDCGLCHPADEDTGVHRYATTPRQCVACHDDPHDGQFEEAHSSCLDCHEENRFRPAAFDFQRHAKVYPLRGGHLAVPCLQCHVAKGDKQVRQFVDTPHQCKICHDNPHGSQFQAELRDDDCTACHSDLSETFHIRPYDHQKLAGYELTGSHLKAQCVDCHRQQPSADPNNTGLVHRLYRDTPTACAACHADIHRGQFLKEDGVACDRCHGSTAKWTAERFDHNRDSQFTLEGVHLDVDCQACHPSVRQSDGQYVVQYRPLGSRCEDCHGFVPK